MSDASASFSIDLKDGTSGAAASAAKALKSLREQIDGDTKALAGMQKQMRGLQGGASVNIAQFRELKGKIDAKKQAIADATSKMLDLGGSMEKVKGSGGRFGELMDKLKAGTAATGGPVAGLVTRLGGLGNVLKAGAIVLGVVAITAALAALVIGVAAATVSLAKWGLANADAHRNELLHLEGLTKLRNWYGLAAGNAVEMQGAIDRVSSSVAIGRGQVSKYTDQLYKMGLRGENLSLALEGVAIKAAVQGEAAASSFAGWAAGAALAGGSVKKLTDDVKARLGGIAAKQMLSLTVQSEKLQESFAALFNGLNLEPLLKGVSMVTSLFSQATASGRALRSIITVMFGPLIDGVAAGAPIVKRFFQGMVIGALTIGIALLKVRNWFKRTFGDSELLRGIDMQKTAVYAGAAAVAFLAGSLALAAVSAAALVAPLALVMFGLFKLGSYAYQAYAAFRDIKWSKLGTSIVQGIVGGLKSGAKFVIDAVRGLGESALSAFKKKLGIASPSKVFASLGLTLPQGVQAGIARGRPNMMRDVERMVQVPEVGEPESAAQPTARGGGAARTPVSVQIGEVHVHGVTEQNARSMAREFREELMSQLETALLQLGGPLPVGA